MSNNAYRRILFISPSDEQLDVAPEVDALTEFGYESRVLQGEVNADRIFEVVRRFKYDIIHFACHGLPDLQGLVMSNGEVLDADSILQVARMSSAKIIYLNACATARLGQFLVDEGIPIVIATLASVEDGIAKKTAQTFYHQLVLTGDPHLAFRAARPSGKALLQLLADFSYQEVRLKPIFDKLDELARLIQCNQEEHAMFHDAIRRWSHYWLATTVVVASSVVMIMANVLLR